MSDLEVSDAFLDVFSIIPSLTKKTAKCAIKAQRTTNLLLKCIKHNTEMKPYQN